MERQFYFFYLFFVIPLGNISVFGYFISFPSSSQCQVMRMWTRRLKTSLPCFCFDAGEKRGITSHCLQVKVIFEIKQTNKKWALVLWIIYFYFRRLRNALFDRQLEVGSCIPTIHHVLTLSLLF